MISNVSIFLVVLTSQLFLFLTLGAILSRIYALDYLNSIARAYESISDKIKLKVLGKDKGNFAYEELEREYLLTKKYSVRRDSSLLLFVFYMYDTNVKYSETQQTHG